MSFSHPWLLSLGGLIVLLGIFYFLKVRPERHATALLFLWESVVPDKKYSALFRRLRDLWSFLLMASAFALITLALAGLHGNAGADRRDLLMVVDLSPSMATEHAGVSRLEEVRLALAGIIENLADGQRMTLAAASGASLTVVQNATDNRRALRRALESLSVGDEPLKPAALELLQYYTANVDSQEGISFDQQLRIALPENVTPEDVSVENDYLTQTITIKIPGADENYLYNYPMIGKSYHIDNLTYESEPEYGVIEISLDSVVELQKTSDEHYIYMDFLTPHEVYDEVVVIDAGHGGNAPGATKQGINEKDIDLAIVLKVKELFDEAGDESVGVYYTRTDDSNPSLEQRVDMANKAGADLFISVHNNSTKSGRMSSINGTAVMYDEEKASEENGSMQLAQICLEEMTAALGSTSKGIVKGHEIYIIRTAEMPVALIEVGFMTNQDELNRLNDEAYQKEAAQAIYNAIYRAFQEGY